MFKYGTIPRSRRQSLFSVQTIFEEDFDQLPPAVSYDNKPILSTYSVPIGFRVEGSQVLPEESLTCPPLPGPRPLHVLLRNLSNQPLINWFNEAPCVEDMRRAQQVCHYSCDCKFLPFRCQDKAYHCWIRDCYTKSIETNNSDVRYQPNLSPIMPLRIFFKIAPQDDDELFFHTT